jgi:hypothetical protein
LNGKVKSLYPDAVSYLSRLEKIKEKWAACFNQNDIFVADMITAQRGESMNNLMKNILILILLLLNFAFESVLDTRKENTEFLEYRQKNYNVILKLVVLLKNRRLHY